LANNLASYKLDTLAIMRDSRSQFTSDQMLTRYVNKARVELCKRTACLDCLVIGQGAFGTSAQPGNIIPGAMVPGMLPGTLPNNQNGPGAPATASNLFQTIPGLEYYSYQYAKPFLQTQYAGVDSVIYVSQVSCAWSGYLPTLNWLPFPDFQAVARSINLGVSSYPCVWSQKGVGQNGVVYLFPVPVNSNPGTMEWQCICTPKPLYTNDDFEAIPEAYQNAVPYYAARWAYLGQQRTGMAEIMSGLFEEQLLLDGVATDWGHVESFYPDGSF
jgi:hypothetical protein